MSDELLKELVKRTHRPFKLAEYLFDKQLAFVLDPAPFKIAVTTRRSGKSTACVADLINECEQTPNVVCLYITLSRKNAKRLIWQEIKRLNRAYNLKMDLNESDLTATGQNGSILYVCGASDRSEIENFRGLALKKVYIDEGQSFPDYIRDLIDDVLSPALMDYSGSLCVIGTPGPIPSGFFFDISTNPNWSHHFWSLFDNPHLAIKSGKTHKDLLDRELKRRGVGPDDPSIQREWFGKWVTDKDSLVYKYNADKNNFDRLPETPAQAPSTGQQRILHKGSPITWNYILGIDLGYDDADALAVLAWSESTPIVYLVHESTHRHQGISELVEQISKLRAQYDFTKIVIDTAGLGKKITEELSKRYKIAALPAEKARKLEHIELMNDALRTGTLKAKANGQFASDAMRVEWDNDKSRPDKKVISSRFHSDICEAVLYAWRECYGYSHSAEEPRATEGSKQWLDDLEDKAMAHFQAIEDAKSDPFDPSNL